MANFNWTCPYCSRDTTIVESNQLSATTDLSIDNAFGEITRLTNNFIVCPNPECNKVTLFCEMHLTEYDEQWSRRVKTEKLHTWNLLPDSFAKQFPNYIPKPILEDYFEASKIRDLSPKASATLARRCLQGMLRDYWKVSKGRLLDEINAIEDKVDPIIWQSIDSVRKVGNIGAHMEKDINLIVEVDPEEAKLLLELIEMLLEEWYVQRHEREKKLNGIISLGKEKSEARKTK